MSAIGACHTIGMTPGKRDEGLEVERASEAQAVHHHVGDRVVVVQRDLDEPEGPDAPRHGGQQQRQLVGREAREDPRRVERRTAGRRRLAQAFAQRGVGRRAGYTRSVDVVVTTLMPASRSRS